MNLLPVILLVGLMAVSYLIGYPLSLFLVSRNERSGGGDSYKAKMVYMPLVIGYSLINLTVFVVSLLSSRGTQDITQPTVLALILMSLIILVLRRKQEAEEFFTIPSFKWFAAINVILLASYHVLWPVVTGRWLMAYATGDDASRWLMAVDYFQTHFFQYGADAVDSLRFNLRERPLYLQAGATVASLFRIESALAYSVMSGFSAVMSAVSFCLLYESMFQIRTRMQRWTLWTVSILLVGVSGLLPNQFYCGYSTHHFSVYPVLASFAFFAVDGKNLKRFVWIAMWGVLNALYYTNRYAVYVYFCIAVMILFESFEGGFSYKRLLGGSVLLLLSLAVVAVVTLPEVRSVVESLRSGSTTGLTLQKTADYYGGNWSPMEKVLKFFGIMSQYESLAGGTGIRRLLSFGLVSVCSLLALAMAALRPFRHPAYAGLFWSNFVLALFLLLTGGSYVMYKSAPYWVCIIVIGFLASVWDETVIRHSLFRRFGRFLIVCFILMIIVTGSGVLDIYWEMVDQRHTKVDDVTNRLKKTIADSFGTSYHEKKASIFAFDYGAERTPLMRQIFKDFDWQPVRGLDHTFDGDVISGNKDAYDEYRYDYLMYAHVFNGPFDFSGNASSRIFAEGPFEVFTGRSSFVEFKNGVEFKVLRWAESGGQHKYCLTFLQDTAKALFVNNGIHDWIEFEFTSKLAKPGPNSVELRLMPTNPIFTTVRAAYVSERSDTTKSALYRFYGLRGYRLSEVRLVPSRDAGALLITRIAWGYDLTTGTVLGDPGKSKKRP